MSLTIAGESFNVADKFNEGHTLTANEAAAMNQLFRENVRNNFAAKVTKAKEANAFDLSAFQAQLDTYASTYEFGVRVTRGGGTGSKSDPVAKEAFNLALEAVKNAIKAKGHTVGKNGVPLEQVKAKAAELAQDPSKPYLEAARKRVEEMQSIAGQSLDDILGGVDSDAPAEAEAA